MNSVAKLVVIDGDDKYLMMYRSNHPVFSDDPDLPGGTMEYGEKPVKTMIREVYEEAGIVIHPATVRELYSGTDYSRHGTRYILFVTHMKERPEIKMSWEHTSFEWLDREVFLTQAANAKDTYMHMVADVLRRQG